MLGGELKPCRTRCCGSGNLPRNTGFAFDVKAGQSRADHVANHHRFCLLQSRKSARALRSGQNQGQSAQSLHIDRGRADLKTQQHDDDDHRGYVQGGPPRSAGRHVQPQAARAGRAARNLGNNLWRPLSEMPPHGCTENLGNVLAPYGIAVEDVPSPFNIFQHMIIHQDTGELEHSPYPAEAAGRARDTARRDEFACRAQRLSGHGGRRQHRRHGGAVRGRLESQVAFGGEA